MLGSLKVFHQRFSFIIRNFMISRPLNFHLISESSDNNTYFKNNNSNTNSFSYNSQELRMDHHLSNNSTEVNLESNSSKVTPLLAVLISKDLELSIRIEKGVR